MSNDPIPPSARPPASGGVAGVNAGIRGLLLIEQGGSRETKGGRGLPHTPHAMGGGGWIVFEKLWKGG